MINQATFASWIGVLADRYGRELKPPTIRALYDIIAPELTDAEFIVGVRRHMRRGEFFPTPQQIIDAAKPAESPEIRARDVFDRIRNGWHYYDDPVAKEAVRLVGGRDVVWTERAQDVPHALREFVASYVAVEARSAAQAEVEAVTARLPKPAAQLADGVASALDVSRVTAQPRQRVPVETNGGAEP